MIGLLNILVITPVLLSLNTQGFFDTLLKDVGNIAEKTIGKVETIVTDSIDTYSDNNYQTKTTNFSPRQTIYLQVKTNVDGTTKKVVTVLDSNKNKINSYELNKSSTNPFIYTQSFPAPEQVGVSYLDIEILSGENSVYKAQQNINVGNQGGNVQVESKVEATANTGGNVQTNSVGEISPQATPQMIPKIAGDSGKNIASIPARMNEVFTILNNVISSLRQLLSSLKL